jgi:hypothetical protein
MFSHVVTAVPNVESFFQELSKGVSFDSFLLLLVQQQNSDIFFKYYTTIIIKLQVEMHNLGFYQKVHISPRGFEPIIFSYTRVFFLS